MAYVYHLCAQDFRGDILYSLSDLQTHLPEFYARERAKYVGRELVLNYVVPYLDVPWGATVNLSALHPRLLLHERRRLGMPFSQLLTRQLVCIPIDRIAPLRAVQYEATLHWLNTAPNDPDAALEPLRSDFTPFDPTLYQEPQTVSSRHTEYLQRQVQRGEPALGFAFIPHVLVASPVDISGLARVPLADT